MSEQNYYVVIEFSDGLQIIPSNWLNKDMSMVRWPALTNVQRYEKAIRNMEPPKESWTKIPVIKIVAKDTSYEKAQAKLKDAELSTDFDEDSDARADKLKRSRKNRAQKASTSSYDEEEFDGTEVLLDPFPSPPQTINSKNPYKTKKEKAVLIQNNNNQHLAVNDTTLQITNDVPDESACTPQNVSAKKKLPSGPSYASNNKSNNNQHLVVNDTTLQITNNNIPVLNKSVCTPQNMSAKKKLSSVPNYASNSKSIVDLQNALLNKYKKKNTEFAGNKNSNNSSTVGQHIYSHAVENKARNAITELTLDTDNNIIFDFPELEQQDNASALIDPLVSRHTSNEVLKRINASL
ncbi:uncharacterized protein LOC143894967 [Temnothorax americanus]|uniref:uncharacterized protein LOC143894967 n=1 Tax=Temnothorax americanus TaxID=1964332 RepID=UPI00406948CB